MKHHLKKVILKKSLPKALKIIINENKLIIKTLTMNYDVKNNLLDTILYKNQSLDSFT